MSTGPTSLERAFRQEADQLSIFGAEASPDEVDALRGADGKLPANTFRLLRQRANDPARRRGRPIGALNKRSEQLSKLFIQRFGDPVMAMGELSTMPLDQLVESLLIADGTIERRQKLDELLGEMAVSIRVAAAAVKAAPETRESIERLADACEALERVAQGSAGKPGDVALKALNLQLAARRAAAEYVHSKKPVEQNVNVRSDGVIVMPGAPGAGGFAQLDAETRAASEIIGLALKSGQIDAAQLVGMRLIGGQLEHVEDGEFEEVPE